MTDTPDIPLLKAHALQEGENAQMHWYADDRSDDPVDPDARIRLILTDPAQAKAWVAAKEASVDGDDVILNKDWESPRPALSYVRVWARAVTSVLGSAGVDVEQDLMLSNRLDTASVTRGLAAIEGLGKISVEDILECRKIFVSRVGDGPFVLEVTAKQAARAVDWIATIGLAVIESENGARIALGTNPQTATDWIVQALRELEDSPATTLVARYAPGNAEPWPVG